jgi:gluconate:H+ symporter, GntP family
MTAGRRSAGGTRRWFSPVVILVCLVAILTHAGRGQAPPSQPVPGSPANVSADTTGSMAAAPATGGSASTAATSNSPPVAGPLIILVLGVAIVLGLIIVYKINAFIALISAAIFVSLCAPGDMGEKVERVARAFGNTAGGIGVVIGMAAVIGECMLRSGAADRIVRAFVRMLGEKRAPLALMGSGYILAIPVFFDTVFYLLVPLARSLHHRTRSHYLKYILAIAAGGAITHTLVPPTPGPLLMASTLNIDLGMMIMVGALVALPAAISGIIFAGVADRLMPTPMRQIGNEPEPEPLADDELPPLWLAIVPVALPVLLISINTGLTTLADFERAALIRPQEVTEWSGFTDFLRSNTQPAAAHLRGLMSANARQTLLDNQQFDDSQQALIVDDLNRLLGLKAFYNDVAFAGVLHGDETKRLLRSNRDRMRKAELEHLNRLLLEEAAQSPNALLLRKHEWRTPRRIAADFSSTLGNANLALLLSTVVALLMVVAQRNLSRQEVAELVERSLMSGGVIILITAAGGAFGAMLQEAQIGDAVQSVFGNVLQKAGGGMAFLLVGFGLAAVLKIAQGSSTVAMIVGSSMMTAIVTPEALGFHPVYLATAIGGGSLVGSWMNDSGFWIFAKMGGLTETEALKSWTVMLVILGFVALGTTMLLVLLMPMKMIA